MTKNFNVSIQLKLIEWLRNYNLAASFDYLYKIFNISQRCNSLFFINKFYFYKSMFSKLAYLLNNVTTKRIYHQKIKNIDGIKHHLDIALLYQNIRFFFK